MKPMVRIGPAGWSYPDWEGIVYPPKTAGKFDALAYLAHYFDVIEINSTFYRIPASRTCKSWTERIQGNPDFMFTVKANRNFTHTTSALDPKEIRAFHKALYPMASGGRLGFILVQFPWSFRFNASSRTRVKEIVTSLDPLPTALEVRHGSWADSTAVDFVGELGITLCGIDQPMIGNSLPSAIHSDGKHGAYFRLHGRNAKEWFGPDTNRDKRYNYLYAREELEQWLHRIKESADGDKPVYVILNNHFRGQAVANAMEIKAMSSGGSVRIPSPLTRTYPQLKAIKKPPEEDDPFEPTAGETTQPSLFQDEENEKGNNGDPGG